MLFRVCDNVLYHALNGWGEPASADLILRTFLRCQGMKKGDLTKLIDEAVRWRVFNRTVQDIKARNASYDIRELQEIVDQALGQVRAWCRSQKEGGPGLMRVVLDTTFWCPL
ncbi:MAG TPA: ribbon-helix-helix domain-containing protein [Bryobacteraceae bacterium]|nr:ribbon-helix-helix domain-containing protein [Bryobacteraceae bacterium]